MRLRNILLLVSFAPAVLGCESGVAIENVTTETSDVICDGLETCLGRIADRNLPTNCRDLFAGALDNTAAETWDTLIARGTITYNAGNAAACLNEQRALGCDLLIAAVPPVCRDVFTGTVELSGPCTIDDECVGDAFCDAPGCPTVPGTCTARLPNGVDCNESSECQDGLVCEDGVCRSPGSVSGGRCGGGSGLGCPLDEICVGAAATTSGTCTPIENVFDRELGENCNLLTQDLCSPELSCAITAIAVSGPTQMCVAIADSRGPCFPAGPVMCPRGEFCDELNPDAIPPDINGVCAPLPGAGQPCAENALDGSSLCAEGLTCVVVGTVPTCSLVRDNGEACDVDRQCFSGRCEAGLCAAPDVCG